LAKYSVTCFMDGPDGGHYGRQNTIISQLIGKLQRQRETERDRETEISRDRKRTT